MAKVPVPVGRPRKVKLPLPTAIVALLPLEPPLKNTAIPAAFRVNPLPAVSSAPAAFNDRIVELPTSISSRLPPKTAKLSAVLRVIPVWAVRLTVLPAPAVKDRRSAAAAVDAVRPTIPPSTVPEVPDWLMVINSGRGHCYLHPGQGNRTQLQVTARNQVNRPPRGQSHRTIG